MKKNIIIIILIVVILGLCGYFVYDKVLTTDNIIESNEELIAQNYDLQKAEELLEYFGFKIGIGLGHIYSSKYDGVFKRFQALKKVELSEIKKVNCSDIYNETYAYDKNYYSGENGVCKNGSQVEVISYESANKIYKKMYGVDMEKEGLGKDALGRFLDFYDYNETLDSFVKLEPRGVGSPVGVTYLIEQTKSAKKLGNELIIEVYYLLGFPDSSGSRWHDHSLRGVNLTFDTDDYKEAIDYFENEILNNHLDKVDVYEVVFEEIENNFVFKKLSKKLS